MRPRLKPLATLVALFTFITPAVHAQELAIAPAGSPRLTFDVVSSQTARSR